MNKKSLTSTVRENQTMPAFCLNNNESYKDQLARSADRIGFLYKHSNLPGPRGNLELLRAVMETGDESLFIDCLEHDEGSAPTNTPGEFVAACGAAGLGKLVCEGHLRYYEALKQLASDRRWRVREGVAFALQFIGKQDFYSLVSHLDTWIHGTPYEQRAVVAGLCEPQLLRDPGQAVSVLNILVEIVHSFARNHERKSDQYIALKKGLGYGLSVAIAATPETGKERFEALFALQNRDIQWILKENLKKKRMIRMDPEWVESMNQNLPNVKS